MRTSELTGPALEWAVAMCEELTEHSMGLWKLPILEACTSFQYSPSTVWAPGGPIIEREGIEFRASGTQASIVDGRTYYGPTHLIAAMRCYVASKLGATVDIPTELL